MGDLAEAVSRGQELGKLALYFGCWNEAGHYLHKPNGMKLWGGSDTAELALPWSPGLMDGGLLKNGKHAASPDGRVFWTCGGLTFWYAFFWWDRSIDKRGASNSGFYVRGFGWPEPQDAFDFACATFPRVVSRQKHPLILQEPRP